MNGIFPLNLPGPTAFYLTLYILTFVLHQGFMHYVLAGSLYVGWATVWPGSGPRLRTDEPLAATLRDWMPFLLSAAITAGVAPLLFIQIVYQYQFYTANLLLWWRWMLVVPVLIAAFYLLYLIKSSMLWNWPYAVRVAVTLGASMSFVFVGFCWTANHLLAGHESSWPEVYQTGRLPLVVSAVLLRMLVWTGGSFASMAALVGWQLRHFQSDQEEWLVSTGARTLAGLALGGLAVATLAGFAYLIQVGSSSRGVVLSLSMLPYVLLTLGGVALQAVGWSSQWQSRRLDRLWLMISSAGALTGLLGVSVMREGLRLRMIDIASLAQRHADATHVGGFGVFLVATLVVSLLIAWCIRLVQQGLIEGAGESEGTERD